MTQHNDNDKLREALRTEFLPAILHGSDEHRQWLTDAMDAFLAGEPIPKPRGLAVKDPTPTWQAHEPVKGAVAPNEATYGLLRDGTVMKAEDIGVWDNCADVDYDAQVIAFCTDAELPAKDADGYYKHDGSDVEPVSGQALIDVDVQEPFEQELQIASRIGWDIVTRWRPVRAG